MPAVRPEMTKAQVTARRTGTPEISAVTAFVPIA